MTIARAIAVAALAGVVAGSGLAGCAGRTITRGPDVTGGRVLEMFVSSAGRRYERYRVKQDGVLHWGGGANAQAARYTWSGPLTDDERERLFDVIEGDGWFDRDPPSSHEPPDTRYEVQIRGPAGRRSFKVTGDTESIARVHRILEQAARRRLEGYLDALPPPGRQPQ